MSPVYSFTCGHTGRTADYANGFIRVAAVHDAPVIVAHFPCPDRKTAGQKVVVDHDPGLTERSVKLP